MLYSSARRRVWCIGVYSHHHYCHPAGTLSWEAAGGKSLLPDMLQGAMLHAVGKGAKGGAPTAGPVNGAPLKAASGKATTRPVAAATKGAKGPVAKGPAAKGNQQEAMRQEHLAREAEVCVCVHVAYVVHAVWKMCGCVAMLLCATRARYADARDTQRTYARGSSCIHSIDQR